MTDDSVPRIGNFWFISEPVHPPTPSRMAGQLREIDRERAAAASDNPRRQNTGMFADEDWPAVRDAFPFIGWRDHTYYPSGSVTWSDTDQSARYVIDPSLDSPEYLAVIAEQTRTSLDRAIIEISDRRAPGRVGPPDRTMAYDAHIHEDDPARETAFSGFEPTDVVLNRAYGALLGLAIGDALGAPLEFSERDTLPEVREMIGGGPFGLRPGEWTDDTSMALCLADSLIANKGLVPRDLLDRFVRWWQAGENAVTGHCFDIGNATRFALERYQRLRTPAGSGPREKYHAGNGSLMRLAPAAIFAAPDDHLARQIAAEQSETTHANDQARAACEFFATLLVEAMEGRTKNEVLASRFWLGTVELGDIAAGSWTGKRREDIKASGYVIHTLEAALWCVHQTSSFEDALILAVNLANDSDTVGAVTGQLAGALYGRSGIPERWLAKLAWRERIEERVADLIQAGAAARSR